MEEYKDYVVQEGDTIISVAKDNNMKVIDLIETNNLQNIYNLIPGQVLKVPTKETGFEFYTVQKGDNLYSIARKYNIDLDTLTEINGLEPSEYIYPNQRILVPKEGIETYITKMGDTLINLADKLGIPEEDLLVLNENIYLLPGQLIAFRLRNKEI